MSVCNFTQLVSPNTCLGDSLATFNANFSALDQAMCSVPHILPGLGTTIGTDLSEQSHHTVTVSTRNSFVYNTNFDYKSSVTTEDYILPDGTSVQTSVFPYNISNSPFATFSTAALTDAPPEVTLFWTASGSDNTTVYATNSGSSLQFNGPVTSTLRDGDTLYVGGEFTTVTGLACKKFAAINLIGGVCDTNGLQYVGSFINNPFESFNVDLGNTGTVNTIIKQIVPTSIGVDNDLLAIGGSFGAPENILRGRGLVIKNQTTGAFFPFYVNGTVNSLIVKDEGADVYLYVGGDFDYINYGFQGASLISGLRVIANGLAKISLTLIVDGFANSSIDATFSSTVAALLNDTAVINSIAVKGTAIYIGGDFYVKSGATILCKGLACIAADGTLVTTWSPIVDGSIITLAIDGDYLYCGGHFKSYYTDAQFYTAPRPASNFHNAMAFQLTVPATPVLLDTWKPIINGPVSKFAFHDAQANTHVYCYGRFTVVNGKNVSYAVALQKAFKDTLTSTAADLVSWNVKLQNGPSLINNAFERYGTSIIIGGNFLSTNNETRNYLARVNGVGETLLTTVQLSSVMFEFGAQVCSGGAGLMMDYTNFVSATTYPGPHGTVNETTFPIISRGLTGYVAGELVKFFIKRKSASETFKKNINILGWKINFNR